MTKSEQADYLAKEIASLGDIIHAYHRQTSPLINLALLTLGAILSVALADTQTTPENAQFIRNLVLLALPIIMGLLTVQHLNVMSEIAVLAEVRDELSKQANKLIGMPVYIQRTAENLRRLSLATIMGAVLAGLVVFGILLGGLLNAWQAGGWWLSLQITVTLVAVVAIVLAMREYSQSRPLVTARLKEVFRGMKKKVVRL